jgi:FkbM family methyltransferase
MTSTEMRSYSQFGEDIQIWDCLGRRREGFFVEVGANHPVRLSQSYFFELQGWRGILVEPLGEKCALLRAQRPGSQVFEAAAGAPEQQGRGQFVVATDDMLSGLRERPWLEVAERRTVEVRTLDDILAEAGEPHIDFLSVDVEGTELDVLRGLDLHRHRPEILLVEEHLEGLHVHRYLRGRHYLLVRRTGCNNWYVPEGATHVALGFTSRLRLAKAMWVDTWVSQTIAALKRVAGARR